jgi:hypothetical protein
MSSSHLFSDEYRWGELVAPLNGYVEVRDAHFDTLVEPSRDYTLEEIEELEADFLEYHEWMTEVLFDHIDLILDAARYFGVHEDAPQFPT